MLEGEGRQSRHLVVMGCGGSVGVCWGRGGDGVWGGGRYFGVRSGGRYSGGVLSRKGRGGLACVCWGVLCTDLIAEHVWFELGPAVGKLGGGSLEE